MKTVRNLSLVVLAAIAVIVVVTTTTVLPHRWPAIRTSDVYVDRAPDKGHRLADQAFDSGDYRLKG